MSGKDKLLSALFGVIGLRALYGLYQQLSPNWTERKTEEVEARPKVTFADCSRIEAISPEIYNDFLENVLQMPWVFLSDESTLWDFHTERDSNELQVKIHERYGVDVTDISDCNVASILERIQASR